MAKQLNVSKRDRRVQKSIGSLHRALISLIREKDYNSISVTEILRRADVGRSTFYSHFHAKDELLLSGMRSIVLAARTESSDTTPGRDVFWFSLPILKHHEQHRSSDDAHAELRIQRIIHERLQEFLRTELVDALKRERSLQRQTADRELIARFIAATFVLILNWWLETRSPLTAKEVDDRFRGMVLRGTGAIGSRG